MRRSIFLACSADITGCTFWIIRRRNSGVNHDDLGGSFLEIKKVDSKIKKAARGRLSRLAAALTSPFFQDN